MKNKKTLKKYQITWTANAFETIEAYDLQEAIDLARDEEPPQMLDFVVSLSDPEVSIHPDETESK